MSIQRRFLSWVHFGDLHIREAGDENYQEFLDLIEEANEGLAGKVDFAFLPGDNADDGEQHQYQLVRRALDKLRLPVHIIVGDHDAKQETWTTLSGCWSGILIGRFL